jgi:hypothetical protein
MDSQPHYEFSEDQNLIFQSLSRRMRLFGTTSILVGLLVVLGALWMVRRLDQPWALFLGVVMNALYFFVLGGPTSAVAGSLACRVVPSRAVPGVRDLSRRSQKRKRAANSSAGVCTPGKTGRCRSCPTTPPVRIACVRRRWRMR